MVMLVLAGTSSCSTSSGRCGLCSYLLIGSGTSGRRRRRGKKAFIVNRVGDFGFGLAIMLIWVTFGTLGYAEVFAKPTPRSAPDYTAIALLLFMGPPASRRSSRSSPGCPMRWKGRRRVRAHPRGDHGDSGVYMVARCHKLFEMAPLSLEIVAWVGGLTALFAASIGLVQTDIKRVLAYSTISQLGYMFAVSRRRVCAGIFHLVTHAFFKALLFLGAGSVIHGLGGEQDLRRWGAWRRACDHHGDLPRRRVRTRGRAAAGGFSPRTRSSPRPFHTDTGACGRCSWSARS